MTQAQHAVRIELPADPGFLRLARLNATAYGARIELDIDQLDDLRLAVNEALTWLIDDPGRPGTVALTIHQEGAQIVLFGGPVTGDATPPPADAPPVDDLIAAILGATVDAFWLDGQTPRRFEIRKSARPR